MVKKSRPKLKFNFYIFILFLYFLLLIANYIIGSKKIVQAHKNRFNGGLCYEAAVLKHKEEYLCDKKTGFDFYYLSETIILLGFILGVVNVLLNKSLTASIIITLLGTGYFIFLIEILTKLRIPILYTHFMEGRQSFMTSFFSTPNNIIFSYILLLAAIVASFGGNIIAFLIAGLIRKIKTNK